MGLRFESELVESLADDVHDESRVVELGIWMLLEAFRDGISHRLGLELEARAVDVIGLEVRYWEFVLFLVDYDLRRTP